MFVKHLRPCVNFFYLPKLITPVQTLPTSALENKVLSTIAPENVDRQKLYRFEIEVLAALICLLLSNKQYFAMVTSQLMLGSFWYRKNLFSYIIEYCVFFL